MIELALLTILIISLVLCLRMLRQHDRASENDRNSPLDNPVKGTIIGFDGHLKAHFKLDVRSGKFPDVTFSL